MRWLGPSLSTVRTASWHRQHGSFDNPPVEKVSVANSTLMRFSENRISMTSFRIGSRPEWWTPMPRMREGSRLLICTTNNTGKSTVSDQGGAISKAFVQTFAGSGQAGVRHKDCTRFAETGRSSLLAYTLASKYITHES